MAPENCFYRMRLPHWEVPGGIYFLTMSLHGALPREVCARISRYVAARQQDPRQRASAKRLVFRLMEQWLHRSRTVNRLADPRIARMVMEAIRFREAAGVWRMKEFVLMPNHLHALFSFGPAAGDLERKLEGTLIDFKIWTGRQACKLSGTHGKPFWQREWFDHWCRSRAEANRWSTYIRKNPFTAGLVRDHREWPYGSWSEGR